MSVFAQLGMPLVNQAPGIELQDDGIHWKVSSHEAVLALVDVLIRESAPTANFRVSPPYGNGGSIPPTIDITQNARSAGS